MKRGTETAVDLTKRVIFLVITNIAVVEVKQKVTKLGKDFKVESVTGDKIKMFIKYFSKILIGEDI